jgi:hypoxanthine phosphoribosyltransferase
VAEAWPSVSAGLVSLQTTTERTHDNTICYPQRQQAIDRRHGPRRELRFAHPAEAVVADLLSSFGVRWSYEPVTFPLVTSESGRLVQCFTPDFYLPDHDVYIEMTTMRQSLVTRKNRKFRLMRELYPDVNVRLLYRKDVELIVEHYGGRSNAGDAPLGPLLVTADQIAHKAREIAAQVASESRPVSLIAVGEGALRFRDAIAAALAGMGIQASAALALVKRSRRPLVDGGMVVRPAGADAPQHGRRILVADVVSTGLTVNAAQGWFRTAGLPIDTTFALFDRRSARIIDVPLGLPGLSAPSAWIVGAGLGAGDTAQRPDIHCLARPIQSTTSTES